MASRRRLRPDDLFFAAGNEIALRDTLTQIFFYTVTVEYEESSSLHTILMPKTYPCPAHGCHHVFESLEECDSHYFNMHTRECGQCRAVLPNDHLLDLHISEAHDSYFASALERGKATYSCLIATCESSFECERARHRHLTEDHLYPRWFRFHPQGGAIRGNLHYCTSKGRKGEKRIGRRGKGKRSTTPDTFEPGTLLGMIADESYEERKQKQLEKKKARKERQKKARALIPCKFHLMEGGCQRGDRCDFCHSSEIPVKLGLHAPVLVPASDSDTCTIVHVDLYRSTDTCLAIDALSKQLERS